MTLSASMSQVSKRNGASSRELCRTLRSLYPVFSYNAYSYNVVESGIEIKFEYSIGEKLRFAPELLLRKVDWPLIGDSLGELDGLVFHLGLIELLSYWKVTCSPVIEVGCGYLDPDQTAWWNRLILNGMGEFFFTNSIDFADDGFVAISVNGATCAAHKPLDLKLRQRSLVPVGGGRDSAFTLRTLGTGTRPFRAMILNPTPAPLRVAALVQGPPPIVIERAIDPLLLDLNRNGFMNGHTPFSAYLAFLGALCLAVYNYSEIVIANERSANEPNTFFGGLAINHQYSKSFQFETDFDEYLERYLLPSARYFSFVRSLNELQIAREFARIPEMLCAFRSCNRMQRSDGWCRACAKCVSVYITSYPFIDSAKLREVFGTDLYELGCTVEIARAIMGHGTHRPLDCICGADEATVSIAMAIEAHERRGEALPPALAELRGDVEADLPRIGKLKQAVLESRGPDRLPPYFSELIDRTLRHNND